MSKTEPQNTAYDGVTIVYSASVLADGVVELSTDKGGFCFLSEYKHKEQEPERWNPDADKLAFLEGTASRVTKETKAVQESKNLYPLLQPALDHVFSKSQDLVVLELGPNTSTVAPEVLKERLKLYTAIELIPGALRKQRQFLDEDELLKERTVSLVANTYELPFKNASQDAVVTVSHPPFVSAAISDKKAAFTEVWRVLKDGGFFFLGPWYFKNQPPEVTAFALSLFELQGFTSAPIDANRRLLILKKRPV